MNLMQASTWQFASDDKAIEKEEKIIKILDGNSQLSSNNCDSRFDKSIEKLDSRIYLSTYICFRYQHLLTFTHN